MKRKMTGGTVSRELGADQTIRFWLLWGAGVALFPLAGLLAPRGTLPMPNITDGSIGLPIFLLWALAFAAMACGMYRIKTVPLRTLVIAQLLGGLVVICATVLPSTDTYAYLGFGDMLSHGENPWHPGIVPPRNEIATSLTTAWENPPVSSPYGAVFLWFEVLIVRVFHGVPVYGLIIIQRLLSLLAAIAVTALIRGPTIRFWALNPFVMYFYAMNAHNDVIFLAILAWAIRIRGPYIFGLLTGVAALIKVVALGALAVRGWRRAVPAIAGACTTFALSAIVIPKSLSSTPLYRQVVNFENSPTFALRSIFLGTHIPHRVIDLASIGVVALFMATVTAYLRWNRRDSVAVGALIMILASPLLWPWYFGWALLPAVATAHKRTLNLTIMISLSAFVLELPQFGLLRFQPHAAALFTLFVLLSAWRSGWAARAWQRTPLKSLRALLIPS